MQNKECEELLKTCHSSKGVSLHDVAMIGMPKNAGKKPGYPKKRSKKKKSVQDKNHVPANFSQVYKKPANDDTGSSLNTSTYCGTSIPDLNATNST